MMPIPTPITVEPVVIGSPVWDLWLAIGLGVFVGVALTYLHETRNPEAWR